MMLLLCIHIPRLWSLAKISRARTCTLWNSFPWLDNVQAPITSTRSSRPHTAILQRRLRHRSRRGHRRLARAPSMQQKRHILRPWWYLWHRVLHILDLGGCRQLRRRRHSGYSGILRLVGLRCRGCTYTARDSDVRKHPVFVQEACECC